MSEPTTPEIAVAGELRAAAKIAGCDHRFPVRPRRRRPGRCESCGQPWDRYVVVPIEVAVPLADLLSAVDELATDYPDLGREHVDGEPCGDHACGIVSRARRVARVINGSTDE